MIRIPIIFIIIFQNIWLSAQLIDIDIKNHKIKKVITSQYRTSDSIPKLICIITNSYDKNGNEIKKEEGFKLTLSDLYEKVPANTTEINETTKISEFDTQGNKVFQQNINANTKSVQYEWEGIFNEQNEIITEIILPSHMLVADTIFREHFYNRNGSKKKIMEYKNEKLIEITKFKYNKSDKLILEQKKDSNFKILMNSKYEYFDNEKLKSRTIENINAEFIIQYYYDENEKLFNETKTYFDKLKDQSEIQYFYNKELRLIEQITIEENKKETRTYIYSKNGLLQSINIKRSNNNFTFELKNEYEYY